MAPEIHGVLVVIFNPKTSKFLLQERADGKGLVFPGGGFDFSEAPETAVRRELFEELGIELPISEVFGILIQRKKVENSLIFGFLHLFFIETTEEKDFEFKLDPTETLSVHWLSLDEILNQELPMLATKRIAVLFDGFRLNQTPITGKLGEPVGYQGLAI